MSLFSFVSSLAPFPTRKLYHLRPYSYHVPRHPPCIHMSTTRQRVMRFRPCIDLHNGRVKQIVGSSLTSTLDELTVNFESEHNASYFAEMYRRDGLWGGHVIMLGPGNKEEARNALQAFPGGLQVGGGIRPENAEWWIKQGASGVIVTSYCFRDGMIVWERVREMMDVVGKENLVLDLSCRWKENDDSGGDYYICTNRWEKWTDFALNRENVGKLEEFCSEILVHAVDVEGKKAGIDERLVDLLGKICTLPITYAGGVQSFGDLDRVRDVGAGKVDVTIGSALDIFGGSLPYKEAVKWQRNENV